MRLAIIKSLRKSAFWLLSKQDGSIVKEIELPYEHKISPFLSKGGWAAGPRNTELISQKWKLGLSRAIYRYDL